MFANDQAPLSSRTVRFISGIHFPPGVKNTSNAALYGVENINRGCRVDVQGDAVFNAPFPRPEVDRGRLRRGRGRRRRCRASRPTRAAARAADRCSTTTATCWRRSASPPARRTSSTPGQDQPGAVPVNPGGIPIYRGGKVIGGVGVAGVRAGPRGIRRHARGRRRRARPGFLGTARHARRGLHRRPAAALLRHLHEHHLHPQDAADAAAPDRRPALVSTGTFSSSRATGCRRRRTTSLGPRGSTVAGGLTVDEVRRIIDQSVAVALADARDDPAADQPAGADDDQHLGRDRHDPRALPHGRRHRLLVGRRDDQGAQRLLLQHARGLRGAARHRRKQRRTTATRGRRNRPPARAGRSPRARSASPGSRSSRRASISRSSSRSTTPSRSMVRGSISTSTTRRTRAPKGPGASRGGNRSFLEPERHRVVPRQRAALSRRPA